MANNIKNLNVGGTVYQINAYNADNATTADNALSLGGETAEAWKNKIAGNTKYLGTVESETDLKAKVPDSAGDFVRVLSGFTLSTALSSDEKSHSVHAGDLLICETAAGESSTWSWVHGEEGNLISHKHYYTPSGTVSKPTFSGTAESHTHTVSTHTTHAFAGTGVQLVGSFTGDTMTSTGSYTPEGTVAITVSTPSGSVGTTVSDAGTGTPDFYSAEGTTGSNGAHTHTISVAANTNGNYTPEGSISGGAHNHTFSSGSAASAGAHTHTVSTSATYTPAGSVSGGSHSHTVSGTYDSTTQTLTINASTGSTTPSMSFSGTQATISASGTAASAGAHTHTVSGTIASATPSLSFTGTKVLISAESNGAHTHSFTGKGKVINGSFSGNALTVNASFTGKAKTVSVSGKPAGSVDISVGTGTANYTPSGTITTNSTSATTSSTSITPKGTISQPTFTGTRTLTEDPS